MMLIITIPAAVAFAGEDTPVVIPWSTIITLLLVIVTAVAGGLVASFRRALKASYEALGILNDALEDGEINDAEIKQIINASVNCHASWKDVIKRIGDLIKKRNPVV